MTIEIDSTGTLQDVAEVMLDMEVNHGVPTGNVYEIVTPLWSGKLSRGQVDYLIEGSTLKIEQEVLLETKKPKQKHSIPFWANNWRKK